MIGTKVPTWPVFRSEGVARGGPLVGHVGEGIGLAAEVQQAWGEPGVEEGSEGLLLAWVKRWVTETLPIIKQVARLHLLSLLSIFSCRTQAEPRPSRERGNGRGSNFAEIIETNEVETFSLRLELRTGPGGRWVMTRQLMIIKIWIKTSAQVANYQLKRNPFKSSFFKWGERDQTVIWN